MRTYATRGTPPWSTSLETFSQGFTPAQAPKGSRVIKKWHFCAVWWMMIELPALIKTEDSSQQSTDVKGNNPFDLEFGPGFKYRDRGQELGFQGVLGSVTVHPQNLSTKTYHGVTPLGLFSLLQEQVCSGQSQALQLQQHQIKNLRTTNQCPFEPEPRFFLKVSIVGQGISFKICMCLMLGLMYPEELWFGIDPS